MARHPWTADERAILESLAAHRCWISEARARMPHRSEPSIRCMMQTIRAETGVTHADAPWMAAAVDASRELLAALQRTGLRPA